MIRFIRMCKEEVKRVFLQPWIYICMAGIFLIKFMGTFCSGIYYDEIFVGHVRDFSVLNLYVLNADASFLGFSAFCLCVFPAGGNLVQDLKSNRLHAMLLRSGQWRYAGAQSFAVIFTSAVCMFLGDVLCIISGCLLLGMPFCKNLYTSEILLGQGHFLLFFLFYELQHCMEVSFYALLTLAASILIRNSQFLVILPMVLRYFLAFFINCATIPWLPELISPTQIYFYNYGSFQDNIILQAGYALFFTIGIGVLVTIALKCFLNRLSR